MIFIHELEWPLIMLPPWKTPSGYFFCQICYGGKIGYNQSISIRKCSVLWTVAAALRVIVCVRKGALPNLQGTTAPLHYSKYGSYPVLVFANLWLSTYVKKPDFTLWWVLGNKPSTQSFIIVYLKWHFFKYWSYFLSFCLYLLTFREQCWNCGIFMCQLQCSS